MFLRITISLFVIFGISSLSFAQRGGKRGVSLSGEHSLGFGIGLITADQGNMDDVIDTANTGGGNVKNLGSGYEFFAQYAVRFDRSWWGFVFRPSFMSQSTDGTCQGGSCSYEVSGASFFPMIRMIPLENSIIKLFFQIGLGYGQMTGSIKQPAGSVKFKGSAFGAIGGLGVDLCITESHCITVEGNLRYLPIERNLITSGSATGLSGNISGATEGNEIEVNSKDLGTTMSGLQGIISYTLMF
jgi:hypothetical protein